MGNSYHVPVMPDFRTATAQAAPKNGEPMLRGIDFFRRSVALANKYRRPHLRVLHTIQTNGTLIDDEWARFFKQNNYLVGVSIDGPRALHDAYRLDKRGEGSFDDVTSLRDKLIKIGAKVVSHGRYVTFQVAEVAVSRQMFADILSLVARLRMTGEVRLDPAEQRVSAPRRNQLAVSTGFRGPCERFHLAEDPRRGDDDLATARHPKNVGKIGSRR